MLAMRRKDGCLIRQMFRGRDIGRYLQKYEIVRTLLKGQFPEVEEALLDKLASDFCEEA